MSYEAENDNPGGSRVPLLRMHKPFTFIFEVRAPGFWGFIANRSGIQQPITTRDMNRADPMANEVAKPRRRMSHLQIVK